MPSGKCIGYIGGAAVAAGVGAAIAVAGQGVAQADNGDSKASASESKTSEAGSTGARSTEAKSTESNGPSETGQVDAGPKRPLVRIAAGVTKDLPTVKKSGQSFDQAGVVTNLKKKFSTSNPPKKADPPKDADEPTDTQKDADEPADDQSAADESVQTFAEPSKQRETVRTFRPLADLTAGVSQVATTIGEALGSVAPSPDPDAESTPAATIKNALAASDTWFVPNTGPVPWNWNPFRQGDPIPNDVPELVWQLEQASVNLFDRVPVVQPVVREGFEFGYRVSQMIPWVNVVVPLTNIAGDIPNLISGDPVLFRDATQSIINNLLVTTGPVSFLFYGYDQIADIVNLEYEAQQLKDGFYRVSWDVIDFFGLLHNKGQSGLPLSQNPAGGSAVTSVEPNDIVTLAAAVSPLAAVTADDPLSNPFRPDDPDPKGVPATVLRLRDAILAPLPEELQPYVREVLELAYRSSQIVPWVNTVVPITEILPALVLAVRGDKDAAQIAVNQLLLTTGPVSTIYYGYDEVADLLNVEDGAWALKEQFYATVWDAVDFAFLLHNPGESGLETVSV